MCELMKLACIVKSFYHTGVEAPSQFPSCYSWKDFIIRQDGSYSILGPVNWIFQICDLTLESTSCSFDRIAPIFSFCCTVIFDNPIRVRPTQLLDKNVDTIPDSVC